VTLALPQSVTSENAAPPVTGDRRRHAAETLGLILAFVGLGYALMHTGGRESGSTELALIFTAPSLLLSRVWRTVPVLEQSMAALIAVTAAIVPLVTPLGVSHAADLATYGYGAVLFLVMRGYSRDSERRRPLVVGLLVLALVESLNVFRVWVGEHDPTFQVVGTLYWHNQFGVFAAAVALLATAMVMRSSVLEDAIAWLVAPLFLALTWLSHSRAAALAFLIGAICIAGVALARRHWLPLARAALAVGLAIAVHAAFIAAASSPGTAGQAYSPGKDTLASTSAFRLTAAEEAAKVFAKAPLVSHGFGSLAVTGWQGKAPGTVTSPYAHSAELQALSDGGLLLGLPVALAALLMTAACMWCIRRAGSRRVEMDWIRLGAASAGVAMLAHTSMDFDSQYPVLTALLGLLVVIALPIRERNEQGSRRGPTLGAVLLGMTAAAAVLAAVLVAASVHTHDQLDRAASLLQNDSAASVAIARDALDDHAFIDPRPAVFVVEATSLGYVFDDATLHRALGESRDYAKLDPSFGRVWTEVNRATLAASPSTAATTTSP
jgi:hypothetical protein